jgi:hypothetical protein
MDRSKHVRRRRIGSTAVAATAICAAILAAPAAAKLDEYAATLKLPSGKNNGYIEFKVKSKKNKQTKKLRPVVIKKLGVFTVSECSDGVGQEVEFYPSLNPFQELIPVSGRRFSLVDTIKGVTSGEPYTETINFSGRIPRHGPPTGTLRHTGTYPKLVPDPANPDGPFISAQVSCDTGPMKWTGMNLEGVY